MAKSPEEFMRQAIALSAHKMEAGFGGPFAAIIVKGDEIIAQGFNCVTPTNDPTAHAEVVAIREACQELGSFSLEGCEIYSSCEPCPMCYANTRLDAAEIGFDDDHLYREISKKIEARVLPMVRIDLPEARAVFRQWQDKPDKVMY
jgi:DNA-binding helix-hairpin-helix protein with protein kinase domain